MRRLRGIRRSRTLLAGAALAFLGIATSFSMRAPVRVPPPAPPVAPDQLAPELVRIEPGTVVGDLAPPGWTHSIIRTSVQIESGDLDVMPKLASRTAERIRTAMLAAVRPPSRGAPYYSLERVGVGLTMACRGANMVVSPESVDRLRVPMNIIDHFVLRRAGEAAQRGRLAARTPTFALYDASLELTEGPLQIHRSIYLRHALLVDARTGMIRTLIWPVAENPALRKPPEHLIEVAPGLAHRSGVHVHAEKLLGRIPIAWFFAMTDLPRGVVHPLPATFREMSVQDPGTFRESVEMEHALRLLLDESPSGQPEWLRRRENDARRGHRFYN